MSSNVEVGHIEQLLRSKYQVPVLVSISGSLVSVKLAGRVSEEEFAKYVETSRKLGLRFSSAQRAWVGYLSTIEQALQGGEGRWYRSYLILDTVDERRIRKVTCFTVQRWRKSENGRNRRVEEEICLHRVLDGGKVMVPRGMVPLLDGVRPPPFTRLNQFKDHERLRPYQNEVLRNTWHRLMQTGAGTIQIATGGGKSYMAGYLAKLLAEEGYHVFLVALQVDLVYQLEKFAKSWGAPMDKIHPVTVQTLYKRIAKRDISADAEDSEERNVLSAYADEVPIEQSLVDLFLRERKVALIIDEVHHLPARTVKEIAMRAGDGWGLRVGLSATPYRNDDLTPIIYAFGGAIVEPTISSSYLIEHGFAVPVEIRVVEAPRCEVDMHAEGVEGYAKVRRQLAQCKPRNEMIVKLAAQAEKPMLIITQLVSHAKTLYEMIKRVVPRTALVTGAVKGKTRQEIYEGVEKGEIEVLVATQLADEGLDLPMLRSEAIVMGGRSLTRVPQRIGRLVRPWQGKSKGVAYELYDKAPFFEEHIEARLAIYRTEPHWRIVSYPAP
jgi:superfamily II DNA or RNA helicase